MVGVPQLLESASRRQLLFMDLSDLSSNTIVNDEAALGLTGTSVESSDANVAEAVIDAGKIKNSAAELSPAWQAEGIKPSTRIKITSVSEGQTVIMVFDDSENEAVI